jgi:hypothetical protein
MSEGLERCPVPRSAVGAWWVEMPDGLSVLHLHPRADV